MVPDPDYPETPATAAICVYPDMVPTAVAELKGPESSPRWLRFRPAARASR